MARVICVTGGKGGVGKTTTVSNLGSAMCKLGKDVTLIDTNLTTPNLSIHLGIPLYPITLHDVLKDDAYITEAMHIHQSGLRVVPGSLSLEDMGGTDPDNLHKHVKDLNGTSDFILLDAAAGLGGETLAAIKAADDLLLVTNPDLPSTTDALKTKKLADELGVNVLGVVVTRSDKKKKQMTDEEIEDMLDVPILIKIPEDKTVQDAIREKMPAVLLKPKSKASKAYKKLAENMLGEKERKDYGSGFFNGMRKLLVGN